MAKNKSGQTAFGAALARLIEQYQPANLRLFEGNLLQHLLPRSVVIFTKAKFIRTWMITKMERVAFAKRQVILDPEGNYLEVSA